MPFTDHNWKEVISVLKKYKQKHGHVNVTSNDDARLYGWVCQIRKDHEVDNLTQLQIYDLFDLDFVFDPAEVRWNCRIQQLLRFQEEFGHVNVPNNYSHPVEGSSLSNWIKNIRYMKTWKLSPARIDQLDEIGLCHNRDEVTGLPKQDQDRMTGGSDDSKINPNRKPTMSANTRKKQGQPSKQQPSKKRKLPKPTPATITAPDTSKIVTPENVTYRDIVYSRSKKFRFLPYDIALTIILMYWYNSEPLKHYTLEKMNDPYDQYEYLLTKLFEICSKASMDATDRRIALQNVQYLLTISKEGRSFLIENKLAAVPVQTN